MPDEPLKPAPDVTLTSFGHGRALRFSALGVPAALVCFGRETSGEGQNVLRAIRAEYPDPKVVLTCTVADGRGIPKLLRKVAEQMMKIGYEHAVRALEDGRAPEDYVLIVPDWNGDLLGPLGIEDVSKAPAVAVLTADGRVAGVCQGDDAAAATLSVLGRLLA